MGGRSGDNTMMYGLSCVDKVSERKAWGQHYDVRPVICRQGQWEEGLGTIL